MGEIKRYTAKVFRTEKFMLGESPFYDDETKLISFVDITGEKFYKLNSDGELSCVNVGQMVGAAVPGEKAGTYVLAAVDGLYLEENGSLKKCFGLTGFYETYQRSNDAKADATGRLYVGSINFDFVHGDCGDLYCYDNGNIRVVQPNTKISNGMAWSKDCTKFYFSDSTEHAVFEYDYDAKTGDISNRKVLFEVGDGVPDGMCIDSEEHLWLAVWGGHRIECHDSKNGELLAVIDVAATNVTSCCFFGEGSSKLFITTSGDGQNGEFDGCLFTCDVDAKGTVTDRCKL